MDIHEINHWQQQHTKIAAELGTSLDKLIKRAEQSIRELPEDQRADIKKLLSAAKKGELQQSDIMRYAEKIGRQNADKLLAKLQEAEDKAANIKTHLHVGNR